MSFDLKGKLVRLKQEQDGANFDGIKQDYKFSGIPFRVTKAYVNSFKEEYLILAWHAIHLINNMDGEKERVQVLTYNDVKFYVVSNCENGTEADDYEDPNELSVTFMMPSDY